MERCCHHSNRLKLLVTFHERKFVAFIHRDATCSETLETLNALAKEVFPEEGRDMYSLSLDGYLLPGKYLIGDICENGDQVEAKSAETKKQKRSNAASQPETAKKPKRGAEVTPVPKVKFASLFQSAEVKAEDKASDPSDSDDSVFQAEAETKPRANVFRK